MEYVKISFKGIVSAEKDILIAELSEAGFDGFEEDENALFAFVRADGFSSESVDAISKAHNMNYTKDIIKEQNWNADWESNFEPVIVDDFCTIRADFHKINADTKYDLIVIPKMSFGTGHHSTTQLMVRRMRYINFNGMRVLDFGTGTGILAIMADKLGAVEVVALDNDEWSYENAIENIARNDCSAVSIRLGGLEDVNESNFNIILANINRHILLKYMKDMYAKLTSSGLLLLSGLLIEDEEVVIKAAVDCGFRHSVTTIQNNWIAMEFFK